MLKDKIYTTWVDDNSWGFKVISGPYAGIKVRINDIDIQGEGTDAKIDLLLSELLISVYVVEFAANPAPPS